jgi:hypothetical protein
MLRRGDLPLQLPFNSSTTGGIWSLRILRTPYYIMNPPAELDDMRK